MQMSNSEFEAVEDVHQVTGASRFAGLKKNRALLIAVVAVIVVVALVASLFVIPSAEDSEPELQ